MSATETTDRKGPAKAPRSTTSPRLAGDRVLPEPTAALAASEPVAPARPRRGAVARSLPWVLVAITTAAAVVFALLWHNVDGDLKAAQAVDHERASVVATGTDFLTALTNFSADTIDSDVRRIRGFAVGDFADQVDQFFGPTNVAALKKAEVVSSGVIRSVFVQSIDGPQASVFGVIDEAVRNAHSAPRTETLRINVEMLQTSDGWKVASVDILPSPGGGPLG